MDVVYYSCVLYILFRNVYGTPYWGILPTGEVPRPGLQRRPPIPQPRIQKKVRRARSKLIINLGFSPARISRVKKKMAANYCEVGVFHQKVLIMNKYNQLISTGLSTGNPLAVSTGKSVALAFMLGWKNSFLSEVFNLYQSENQYKLFSQSTTFCQHWIFIFIFIFVLILIFIFIFIFVFLASHFDFLLSPSET